MSDPPLALLLNKLADVVKRLNDETAAVNAQIEQVENALIAMNPGIAMYCERPLHVRSKSGADVGSGADFGFFKVEDEWRLWVRRGIFKKADGEWRHDITERLLPLLEGTREERAAAVGELPALLEGMRMAAENRLQSFQAAQKKRGAR
jgi:hypothetical protein